jgi:phosphotransferase system enzyme I (PtsP)
MASNPIEAMVLIGLGYRNLSISGASFGKVKNMIRSANASELSDYISTLLDFNQRTLRPQLIAYANDHGIEIF